MDNDSDNDCEKHNTGDTPQESEESSEESYAEEQAGEEGFEQEGEEEGGDYEPVQVTPTAGNQRARENKRTPPTADRVTMGIAVMKKECRTFARDMFNKIKAPIEQIRPSFCKHLVKYLMSKKNAFSRQEAETFVRENEKDFWGSLCDRRNNVAKDVRNFLACESFEAAVLAWLLATFGLLPSGDYDPDFDAEASEDEKFTEKRSIASDWIVESRDENAEQRRLMFRPQVPRNKLMVRLQLVAEVLGDPRSHIPMWPVYETLMRACTQMKDCNVAEHQFEAVLGPRCEAFMRMYAVNHLQWKNEAINSNARLVNFGHNLQATMDAIVQEREDVDPALYAGFVDFTAATKSSLLKHQSVRKKAPTPSWGGHSAVLAMLSGDLEEEDEADEAEGEAQHPPKRRREEADEAEGEAQHPPKRRRAAASTTPAAQAGRGGRKPSRGEVRAKDALANSARAGRSLDLGTAGAGAGGKALTARAAVGGSGSGGDLFPRLSTAPGTPSTPKEKSAAAASHLVQQMLNLQGSSSRAGGSSSGRGSSSSSSSNSNRATVAAAAVLLKKGKPKSGGGSGTSKTEK